MPVYAKIDQTDEDLARRARAGSVDCFEELVRRYQVPLLRFLQRRSPNPREAEDVIQEAFLRAYQSMDRYREGEPFKPWLFTIAYRLAIDHARRKPRWDQRQSGAEDLPKRNDNGPLAAATVSDSHNHLWRLVRSVLADDPYTAVWLHYGESMSTADIAKVTGRSRVWVKTTLLRSRGKIKVALQHTEQF